MPENFADRLMEAVQRRGTPLVVGLDPRFSQLPSSILKENREKHGPTVEGIAQAITQFNFQIIDLVAERVAVVKPQMAFYECYGAAGIQAFMDTVRYAQQKGLLVIGDVKRNDIGSTMQAYAKAYLSFAQAWNGERISTYDVDAITVNAYCGSDSINPVIQACREAGKGAFVLVKTSNPSSGEFQSLQTEGAPLFMKVAEKCAQWGAQLIGQSGFSSLGVVVGATYPEEAAMVRQVFPKTIFLVPGIGAQGGSVETLASFFTHGRGAVINSSRGIIHAYRREPYRSRYGEERYLDAIGASLNDTITNIAKSL